MTNEEKMEVFKKNASDNFKESTRLSVPEECTDAVAKSFASIWRLSGQNSLTFFHSVGKIMKEIEGLEHRAKTTQSNSLMCDKTNVNDTDTYSFRSTGEDNHIDRYFGRGL